MTDLTTEEPNEIAVLAAEMARAYSNAVLFFHKELKLDVEEAEAEAKSDNIDFVINTPSDDLTWLRMSMLQDHSPELALETWERIKADARAEFETGHRAVRPILRTGRPMDRACFLVIREAMQTDWEPQTSVERILVDTLAQAYTAWEYWLGYHTLDADVTLTEIDWNVKKSGSAVTPRLSVVDTLQLSAAMADRFNRLFMRTLRALRDLRRYTPNVTIKNAGQVNIGNQQINTKE